MFSPVALWHASCCFETVLSEPQGGFGGEKTKKGELTMHAKNLLKGVNATMVLAVVLFTQKGVLHVNK